jgi:hypothetical protein
MLELLRDPVWQFVGAVLAVAALVATFVIYQLQRQRKALTYELVSKTHLLTVREELEGKLQVLYEGEPARSLSVLVLKLWNSGNQPLLASEYERPISFCLGKDARVLSADITNRAPSAVAVNMETQENRLVIEPTLLNPGDSITFKLLVRDVGAYVSPDARIAGVKSIQLSSQGGRSFPVLVTVGMVLIAIGFYVAVTGTPKPAPKFETSPKEIVGIAVASVGYFAMLYALLKTRKVRLSILRLLRDG